MFYMMKKYDLTTEAGRSFMEILFPGPSLVYKIGKAILARNSESTRRQKEMAEALIEKGYRDGVDEMEITVNNSTGVKINIPTDKCSVDTLVGTNDKMTLRIKYK